MSQPTHIITTPEFVTQAIVIEKLKRLPNYKYIGRLDDGYHTNLREDTLRRFMESKGVSDDDATRAIHELRAAINTCTGYNNLTEASEKVYELLRYGVQIAQIGGTNKTIPFIDWKEDDKNYYEIAEEVVVETDGSEHNHRRPDIVLYVNGIALAVIELKKSDVAVAEGIRQNYRNQQDGNIPRFFTTVQLVMAGNLSEGLHYGTTATAPKFYLKWKEPTGCMADGSSMPSTFSDESELLYRSVLQMLQPDRLLEMIHDLIVYDGCVKKICRPNQYFAIKAAQPRIREKKSGVIWHSQGSGKSLTMVWLAQWIRENIDNARVVIITDRQELDDQITKALRNSRVFAKNHDDGFYHATSGNDLLKKLDNADPWLITTLIHKFATRGANGSTIGKKTAAQWMQEISENLDRNFPGFKAKGNLFVFVDECHRTQGGIFHKAMRKIMGDDVMIIGFTGTPLLAKSEKAEVKPVASGYKDLKQPIAVNPMATCVNFGSYIHCYLYPEAVEDKVVLDLKYEARDIAQRVLDDTAIDQLFTHFTHRLTSMAKHEIQRRWVTLQKLYSSKERMERIVADILKDMALKPALSGGYGNAMLVCDSIYQAYQYWNLFNHTELKDHCAVVSSYEPNDPTLAQGYTGAKKTEEELKYKWAKEMLGDKSPTQFEAWAKDEFVKHPEKMKLLIVVDKLLTGFDAPAATYIYLDKKIVDHNLFQAICRVNRVNGDMKLFGYIIDYMQLFKFIHKAIDDYSVAAEPDDISDYDPNDISDMLKDRKVELKKALDEAIEEINMLTEDVALPRSEEQFFEYYAYSSTVTDDDEQAMLLEKNLMKRQIFYNSVSKLAGIYAEIASELDDLYPPQKVQDITNTVKNLLSIRQSLMLRSGDAVDMKIYDAEMRSLIDRYIGADNSVVNDELKDFTFLTLVDDAINDNPKGSGSSGERGQRETMINNTRKYVNRRRYANPQEYKRLSSQLKRLIADLNQGNIEYHDFLIRIKEINEALRAGGQGRDPWIDTMVKSDLYDNLGEDLELTKMVFETINREASPGFRNISAFRTRIKKAIKRVLKDTKYSADVIFTIVNNHPEQWT